MPIMVSGVRVMINLTFVIVMAARDRDLPGLFGDRRPSLWWRGLFGTFSLILSFASIAAIGVGESSFLQSSSSIFVGLLAPRVLKVANPSGVWLALGAGLLGVALLSHPRLDDVHPLGRLYGLGAGGLAALAYLMIARAGRSNSPRTVIFYFSLVGLVVHAAAFLFLRPSGPASMEVWSYVILAGFCATVGQHFLTRAYQEAPAAWNAIASYSGPVMSLMIAALWFGRWPDGWGVVGAALIVGSGITSAVIHRNRTAEKAKAKSP